jgi:hypothetical protein
LASAEINVGKYFCLSTPRIGVEQFLVAIYSGYMVDALWMRTPKVAVA